MKILTLMLALVATPLAAQTQEYRHQVVRVYDGDTFYIDMPGLPPELRRLGVRVRGVDTPELRGRCAAEREGGQRARAFTFEAIRRAGAVVYLRNLAWDKFGGRIDADVLLGEQRVPLAAALIQSGNARPYLGGRRQGWC